MFNLMHFLHLDQLGFGEKHRAYTMVVHEGAFLKLLRKDGQEEDDSQLLERFYRYYNTIAKPLADGEYELDYVAAEQAFHGLGTRHKKYKLVRTGESEYVVYDDEGMEVDEGPVMDALGPILDDMEDEAFQAIPEDGCQIEFDIVTGKVRGFEEVTGCVSNDAGDSSGASGQAVVLGDGVGQSVQVDEALDTSQGASTLDDQSLSVGAGGGEITTGLTLSETGAAQSIQGGSVAEVSQGYSGSLSDSVGSASGSSDTPVSSSNE